MNITGKKLFLAALLLSVVALFPHHSFASNVASGCGSNANVTISDEANWATLCSKTMNLTGGTHYCVATASAEAAAPSHSVSNQYIFTIDTQSNPVTNSAYERQIELNDNDGVDDPNTGVVSTVRYFPLASGTYTFYWLARPLGADDATITVNDYSMGIVCVDGN